jgi:RND family efflux transporter MFP subunit
MNEIAPIPSSAHIDRNPPIDRGTEQSPMPDGNARHGYGRQLLGTSVMLLLAGGLGYGGWRNYTRHNEVSAIAEQQRDFVPTVQVAQVRASGDKVAVTLPGTTFAYEAANIFARTYGYIEKRNVDIGDHVKAGDVLAELTAPELDHQISQAEATLSQTQATLNQNQASMQLAQVTNDRTGTLVKQGWATVQLGDTNRLSLEAQQAAVRVAQANIAAQRSMVRILNQQKAYQRVIAPFDGVVTQRAVDVGSLVQAGSTFMFTLMHSNVIRVQVFVPQDQAFGLAAGVDAVIRVPEMPDRAFPGRVTRIAEALQQGTRTLLAEVDVPNPDGALRPGIYCSVELDIPRKVPSLLISANAVIFNRDGLQVAVVENDVVHIRKVTVARDLGTQIEVRNGVKAGDQVVLNPMVDLADSSAVRTERPAGTAAASR